MSKPDWLNKQNVIIGLAVALGGYGSLDQLTDEPPPPQPIVIHVEHEHDDYKERIKKLEGLKGHEY